LSNKAFWRAVHSLAHPVSLWAVLLLLLNDHVLRVQWPSWWTGKLGDAAWLVFAPFILAVVVALLIPRRFRKQEILVGSLSILFIGVWFTLAKTTPAVHNLTISVLDRLVGWHGTLRIDPEDLITLPVLLISWFVWWRSQNRAVLVPRVWVVGALGIISMLANSCAIADSGILWLCLQDQTLIAASSYTQFTSGDGGLTWQQVGSSRQGEDCVQSRRNELGTFFPDRRAWLLSDNNQNYRFVRGAGIYSYGENNSEKLEIHLSEIGRDIRQVYYEGRHSGFICGPSPTYVPGPLDAIIDSKTGNLIVAMGLDGILTRTAEGSWQWVTVGNFTYADVSQADPLSLLKPELWSALILLFLLPPTITLFNKNTPTLFVLGLGLCWIALLIMLMFNVEFLLNLMMFLVIPLGIYIIIVIVLNLAVMDIYFNEHGRVLPVLMLGVFSLVTTALFLIPFVAWVRGTIPNHGTAFTFALVLVAASFFTSVQYMKIHFPSARKKKKREEVDTS
jgi:hypothetical protein